MANFGGNFRGSSPIKMCPLCLSNPDTQQWSLKCKKNTANIEIHGTYDDILKGNIDKNLAKTLNLILKFRKMSL